MFITAIVAAVAAQPSLNPPSVENVRSAIWSDVELNAMIGNGNDRVSWEWVFGTDREHPPTLTIVGLKCSEGGDPYKCAFDLTRQTNAAAPSPDETQDPELRCTASFDWSQEERRWVVIHVPPPKHRGHTRTTMRCREKHR